MPPGKLKPSILITLGIALGGCGEKDEDSGGDTYVGPCLSEVPDTGPCLDFPADTGDSGDEPDTGPCLDFPTDTGGDTGDEPDTGATGDGDTRQDATQRVLDSGILPSDVAKLLAKRLKER